MWLSGIQITETNTSRLWDASWYNDTTIWKKSNKNLTMDMAVIHFSCLEFRISHILGVDECQSHWFYYRDFYRLNLLRKMHKERRQMMYRFSQVTKRSSS